MEELPPELIHCIMCYLNPREAVLMLMASNRFNTFSRNGYVELLKGCMRDNMHLGEPPFERIRYLQLSSEVLMKLVEHLEALMNGDYAKDRDGYYQLVKDEPGVEICAFLCMFCHRVEIDEHDVDEHDGDYWHCKRCLGMACDECVDDRLLAYCVNIRQLHCYYCLVEDDCECGTCTDMRTKRDHPLIKKN